MGKSVAITDSYLNSVFKLGAQDRKATLNTVKQLSENPNSPSLHVHSIDRTKCDKRFLSARVNLDLRVIFVKREDVYSLLYVDHHDDAYSWCEGKYLVKTDFGSEYIYDEKLVEDRVGRVSSSQTLPSYLSFAKTTPLLEKAGIKKKQLMKLGIQDIHVDNLLKIEDENVLLDYIEIFPGELQEAIVDLAAGTKPYDQVYNELFCADDHLEQEKNSRRRFYLTEDMDELERLMENDEFEKWTIFLHPSQEKLVRANYRGPALIEGGPGTGKTIVGIHRAAYLSENIFTYAEGKKILFCTFSRKLANSISEKLSKLYALRKIENNVDVMSVDGYIAKMLGRNALNVDMEALKQIITDIYISGSWNRSLEFFQCEYYEVIERLNIGTEEEYLKADRSSMGLPLTKNERKHLWTFFEAVLKRKASDNVYSFVDRAVLLEKMIKDGSINPVYDSIIIDEAQDLEGPKLKSICSTVKNQNNGVLILSDNNQRIFRLNTWSKDVGINIVGRTSYLRINYRTTKQINEYARHQFDFFDLSKNANKEYISIMSGAEPEIIGTRNDADENRVIVERIKALIPEYDLNQICILAPTYGKLSAIKTILEYENINTYLLIEDNIPKPSTGVNLCTTSGVKGLEFSVVIIADFINIGTQRQVYRKGFEVSLDYDKLVECEKYVAITRARDLVFITYIEED